MHAGTSVDWVMTNSFCNYEDRSTFQHCILTPLADYVTCSTIVRSCNLHDSIYYLARLRIEIFHWMAWGFYEGNTSSSAGSRPKGVLIGPLTSTDVLATVRAVFPRAVPQALHKVCTLRYVRGPERGLVV